MTTGAFVMVGLAGLYGAAGVGLWAAAAHGGEGGSLATGAQFLLFGAVALVAIAALSVSGFAAPRLALMAGALIALGTALFSGDLACRAFLQHPLFPMAAPGGGMVMIAGWLILPVAAVIAAIG